VLRHLVSVYLVGMHLIGMYLVGVRLEGVAKSVGDPWGAITSKGSAMYNSDPKNSAGRGTTPRSVAAYGRGCLTRHSSRLAQGPPPMASVQQRQATSTVAAANSNSRKQESASTLISKVASAGVWKV
jgi:hypothetical protein